MGRTGVGKFFVVAGILMAIAGGVVAWKGGDFFSSQTGVDQIGNDFGPQFDVTDQVSDGVSDGAVMAGGIIGFIGVTWAVVGLAVMGYYRKVARRAASEQQLFQTGQRAVAVVERVAPTATSINENPQIVLTLRIKPEGEPEFLHQRKLVVPVNAVPLPGSLVNVAFDPNDRGRVALETDDRFEAPPAKFIVTRPPDMTPASSTGSFQSLFASGSVTAAPAAPGAFGTPPTAPAAPDGGLGDTDIERLERLARLRDQGVLTDAEFAEQKAKLLGES